MNKQSIEFQVFDSHITCDGPIIYTNQGGGTQWQNTMT